MFTAYIALEPFIRKRLPARIISWNRLMANDLRDPLIGRDVLLGLLLGLVSSLVSRLWDLGADADRSTELWIEIDQRSHPAFAPWSDAGHS